MKLSRMQWLTWACWVAGMTSQQTAFSLNVTLQTVKTHRKRIRAKVWPREPHEMETIEHD